MTPSEPAGGRIMPGRLLVWLLAALAAAGCGARREYYLSHLDIRQAGWDTLVVEVGFAWRTAIGKPHVLVPDSTTVHVFDADYTTLFRGAPGAIPVADARLGDRERVLVEVCGAVAGRAICIQDEEWASPKRVGVDARVDYPVDGDFDRGRYDLAFRVERQRFGEEGWERLAAAPPVSGYLLAWVEQPEYDGVRVPFSRPRGAFDLSRHANHQGFRYALDAKLRAAETARVRFDVYAGAGGPAERLASVEKEVERKNREERAAEVAFFAEEATERILDALRTLLSSRRAAAYVDDWTFDPAARTYRVELEVAWTGGFFGRDRYELSGTLEVGEDGTGARFHLRSGNRDGVRRWQRRVDGDVLALGDLGVLEAR